MPEILPNKAIFLKKKITTSMRKEEKERHCNYTMQLAPQSCLSVSIKDLLFWFTIWVVKLQISFSIKSIQIYHEIELKLFCLICNRRFHQHKLLILWLKWCFFSWNYNKINKTRMATMKWFECDLQKWTFIYQPIRVACL